MQDEQNSISTIDANGGQQIFVSGGSYRIVLSGKETNGEFVVIEMTVPPKAGPLPHAHPDIVETFYVLEGEVFFQSDKGSYLAQKGAMVKIDKGGLVHCFKNQTDTPAKLLCTVFPAGLEDFFLEASNYLNANATNPSISQEEKKTAMHAMATKYGNTMYPENYFGELTSNLEQSRNDK